MEGGFDVKRGTRETNRIAFVAREQLDLSPCFSECEMKGDWYCSATMGGTGLEKRSTE